MFELNAWFQGLVDLGIAACLILAGGAWITWRLKQPIERVRAIQWTFAAVFVALVARESALFPQLILPWLPSTPATGNAVADSSAKLYSESSGSPVFRSSVPRVTTNSDAHFASDSVEAMRQMVAAPQRTAQSNSGRWQRPRELFALVCVVLAVLGALWFIMLWAVGRWQLARLLKAAQLVGDEVLKSWFDWPDARARNIRVLMVTETGVPMTFGVWQPIVLLPAEIVKSSDSRRLVYCLSHEWAHIRHGDNATWCLVRLLQPLLWFQPFFWVLRCELRLCQDQLADQFAACDTGDRIDYAELLLMLSRRRIARHHAPALAMAGRSSTIRRRVELLLADGFSVASSARRSVLLMLVVSMVGAVIAVGAVQLERASAKEGEESTTKGSTDTGAAASGNPGSPTKKAGVAELTESLIELAAGQQMLPLPVRVVDEDGKPVANAKVIPWALQSSQGHGLWREGDKLAVVGPQAVTTDENGHATVMYPQYRSLAEQIRTISVSLWVDHPDFAYVDDLHIDVPLEAKDFYEIKLTAGVPLEVRPMIDGAAAGLDDLFAVWSDGRSWQPGAAPVKTADGTFRIPAMPPGENSILLAKLEGERVSHFSKITDLELKSGERKTLDVPLRPSVRISGKLSDNVPRPVRNGRIKVATLSPTHGSNRVGWFTWVPIHTDGTFTIDGWPADEPLQLIALCDGYIATSGKAPDVVQNPPDPEHDSFNRPQVFAADPDKRIELAMTPLVRCVVTAVDEDEKPVAGVTVHSWPNVGWWNEGSQIYCHPLVRGERLLRERGYENATDEAFPMPFDAQTDGDGTATLELPAGNERLAVSNDVYELPVFLGRRFVQIELAHRETTEVTLRLQPRGTEKLGEWDKLAGVVFGCSTREGRRICALPGVQKQMEEFARRFREAKNQRDPQLLSEAYSAVADAFTGVGDLVEAAKWRQKAAEQAAKAEAARPI
jgi:beta-lactamase regulating signal transducer with metallopeptidase domain